MPHTAKIAAIETRIGEYERLIQSFEQIEAEMRVRRSGASTGIAETIDPHLRMLENTLTRLRQSLAHAKAERRRLSATAR